MIKMYNILKYMMSVDIPHIGDDGDELDSYMKDWTILAHNIEEWKEGWNTFALQWDVTGKIFRKYLSIINSKKKR